MPRTDRFDYVIIGAGSSGCVLANRLSASPQARVLLLEAGGPDTAPAIHDPSRLLELWGSEVDWNYRTEPQADLAGRQVPIARGKVLGGSSAIYAMIYVRGNRRDYDRWRDLGNEGWGFDDLLPYFRKSEDNQRGESAFHGVGGPLAVSDNPSPTPVAHAFAQGATELGYAGPDWDFNGPQQENGAGLYQLNVTRSGRRCSTAVAFLAPVLDRPNLTVCTFAHATRIDVAGTRAVGVEYRHAGEMRRAEAEREVILAAGAFDSPKLLMLSGIGPAEALAARGIRPVADLPGVGRHLQDHLLLPVFFTSRRSLPAPGFIAEAGLFVHSAPSTASATPDLQFHFSAGIPAFVPPDYRIDGPHFVFVPILVGPTSEGRVSLRSADPLDAPVIDPNYLHVDDDVEVLCRGIELSRRLARTKAFAEFTGVEVAPGEKCTPQELRQYVRTHCSTVWHVAGTCKMGRDPQAVVDSHLRVHGINGLRVADASVMPTITSGNTNAACVMIGEKAADLILASGVYEVGAAVAAHAGGGSR